MSDPSVSSREFLEIVAGDRCPCGHTAGQHEPPSIAPIAGDFYEVFGACDECECKGVIE